MIEIVKNTRIDFVSKFKMSAILSSILVCISLYFSFSSMKYGVDFSGGAEIQLKTNTPLSLDRLRTVLKNEGLGSVGVQTIGNITDNEYLIKLQGNEQDLNAITEKTGKIIAQNYADKGGKIRKVDIVGPKAGKRLRLSGLQAMLWALIAIMIYIGLRFDFKYSPGAIAALFHDVCIILGIFAMTGKEFTLQIVAALLAVIGYSVNDTVVVYDRVREHEGKNKDTPLENHINNAVNETLSRTILTSGTTLFISLSMYFFGGAAIEDFFFAITLGVIIGTYSSIFVAAPVTLFFDRVKKK